MFDGVREWRNPRNRFYVVRLHYRADDAKRTETWLDDAKAGMPERGWRREYEIDWAAPAGEPVVPEFEPAVHVKEFAWDPAVRLLRGWDFGFVTPAVIFAQQDAYGILKVHSELVPFNTPLEHLLPMVQARSRDLGSAPARVFDAGDPAADHTTDLGNVRAVLKTHGIWLQLARPGTPLSYQALRQRFLDRVFIPRQGQHAAIQIHPQCTHLIEALAGAFHLTEHPPYKPVSQHPYKDIVDALRYLNDNVGLVNNDFQARIAKMARSDIVDLRMGYNA